MKISTAMFTIAFTCLSPLAFANHDPDATQIGHARMDTNGDGWISREEFMAHQQDVWNQLPKNADGLVSTKDMPTHHDKMMRRGGTSMQSDADPGDQAKQEKVKQTESNGQ